MNVDRRIACLLLLPLALSACGREEAAESRDEPDVALAEVDGETGAIPQALHGRWGLVPADCEEGRSDAKGLMTIDGQTLKFYESVAELGEVTSRTDDSIRAEFALTGEGMEWTREMELALDPGNGALVRREFGVEAMDGPLAYARCG